PSRVAREGRVALTVDRWDTACGTGLAVVPHGHAQASPDDHDGDDQEQNRYARHRTSSSSSSSSSASGSKAASDSAVLRPGMSVNTTARTIANPTAPQPATFRSHVG